MDRQTALTDGRRLGYAEHGAADGRPVFYFHGHPGSRLEWSAFDDRDVASELGLRVIAVDRPGMGLSDFQRGRTLLDWPRDVLQLADALDIDRFGIVGISGGGPYAAACAHEFEGRLTTTVIVAGMGPAEAPGMTEGLAWTYPGKSSLVRRLLLRMTAMGVHKKPDRVVDQMAASMDGPDASLVRDRPELARQIIQLGFSEAFRQGTAGVFLDAALYVRPWGFRLENIAGEVHLWHGGRDHNVPISVGRHVATAIPDCRATFIDDEGHLSIAYNRVRDYLSSAFPGD